MTRPPYTTEHFQQLDKHALRLELEELYAEYVACLDEERFEAWPDYFSVDCLYRIVPRENFERNLPIATMHCEGRAGLEDRVVMIRKTAVYAPRTIRRLVSNIRVAGWAGHVLEARANYASFETLPDEITRVFNVGQFHDKIVIDDGRLKFQEKLCVFDSLLVPNSLIYPL